MNPYRLKRMRDAGFNPTELMVNQNGNPNTTELARNDSIAGTSPSAVSRKQTYQTQVTSLTST